MLNLKTNFNAIGDGISDDTVPFLNFQNALKTGADKWGHMPLGQYLINAAPALWDFPCLLTGEGIVNTILLRNYNETDANRGLIALQPHSDGSTFQDFAIIAKPGTTGGSLLSARSSPDWALSAFTLENLDLTTWGLNTHVYTLRIDGSEKTTGAIGVRDVSLKNVKCFGSTSYSVVLYGVEGFSWHGGAVYPAGGDQPLSGSLFLAGIPEVQSQGVQIHITAARGLVLSKCVKPLIIVPFLGDMAGVSVNNDPTCQLATVIGSPSGTVMGNWTNSGVYRPTGYSQT